MKKEDIFLQIAEVYNLPELKPDDMTVDRFIARYGGVVKVSRENVHKRLRRAVAQGLLRSEWAYDTARKRREKIYIPVERNGNDKVGGGGKK